MEFCIPRAEIEHREFRAGDTLAREGCLQVENGSYGGGHPERYLHKRVCFLNVTVRNDFVVNLSAVLQNTQLIPSRYFQNVKVAG